VNTWSCLFIENQKKILVVLLVAMLLSKGKTKVALKVESILTSIYFERREGPWRCYRI
jgi:hypothetical protein